MFNMVDFENISEEQLEKLSNKAVDLYTTISEEALSLNDPVAYSKVRKITNDEDYMMECRFRNLSSDDDFDSSEYATDESAVVEIWFTGAQDNLKNDVHVVDIVFSVADEMADEVIAKWFPDD